MKFNGDVKKTKKQMFDISWMMKASNMGDQNKRLASIKVNGFRSLKNKLLLAKIGDSATSAIRASFILPTSKREQDCAVKPLRYFASRQGKSTLPRIMLVKGMFGRPWIEQQ